MVMSFDETKELENLKHKNKKEMIDFQQIQMVAEHEMKMERLKMQIKIAEAGGTSENGG